MTRQLLALLAALTVATMVPTASAQTARRCFDETGFCIEGRLREFWEQQGGLPVFGYPLGPATSQQGVSLTAQVFERARLELHPENAAPYDVLLGRLGADALAKAGSLPPAAEAPRDGCLFFAETGQNICEPFLSTWQRYGLELGQAGISQAESLALFGLPLTPPQQQVFADGQSRSVQWFERARFEDHGAQGVLLGLLGSELYGAQTPAVSSEGLPPGGFIEAQGSQLVRLGQPVTIKGVNYYPQRRPWAEMWAAWDATQTEREWRAARDQLGINAVRVLLPYSVSGRNRDEGRVNQELLDQLRQLAQIAGNLDMRLIVTLFDFYNDFPAPGTPEEEENFIYLRSLIGHFAGDDRIFAWDIHNEPDNYPFWKEGGAPQVLTWLGRMADEVHRLAPNHLVTVGMGTSYYLWQAGPDGRRVIDYSDLISIHIYNAEDAVRQLEELRTYTDKPILIEEFGWPSGPECSVRAFDEAGQREVFDLVLGAAQGRTVGVMAWTLRDYHAGPTRRWDTREEHYGLYRPDDSIKPAAEALRDYPAPPLPSQTKTNLPLTDDDIRPSGGLQAPLLIPESGRYVKLAYRRAWDLFGGRGLFGLPLSEAYVREEDDRVVQYFEAGLVEIVPGAETVPGFDLLPEDEQIRRRLRFVNVGEIYVNVNGLSFPPPASEPPGGQRFEETGYRVRDEFLAFYDGVNGRWRLGVPISGELTEELNGVPTRVQYFQNGMLLWNEAAGRVEFGPLGRWGWERQCASVQ
jgi:hypothetical protein